MRYRCGPMPTLRPKLDRTLPTQTDELAEVALAQRVATPDAMRTTVADSVAVETLAAAMAPKLVQAGQGRTGLVARVAAKFGVPAPSSTQVTQAMSSGGDTIQFGIEFATHQIYVVDADVQRWTGLPSYIMIKGTTGAVIFDILLPGAGIYLAVFHAEGDLKVVIRGITKKGSSNYFEARPTLKADKLLVPFEVTEGGIYNMTLVRDGDQPKTSYLRFYQGEVTKVS